jgi:ubiquinone/menaquinone biosynthesis C-methylase UbiE
VLYWTSGVIATAGKSLPERLYPGYDNYMPQQSEYHRKLVVNYYDSTQRDYRILWRSNHGLGLHFGYYDDQHRTHDAAILNINRKLADLAEITDKDRVLDAGSGVGGSSLWLAANRGCHVTGISIVPWQIEQANRLAKRRRLDNLIDFQVADFADTSLKEQTFTVFWGLESIVHAEDKQAVIYEAFRLLKPGGRLVISEYLIIKDKLSSEEQGMLDRWLDGWAMPSLMTEGQYEVMATKAGFSNFEAVDWTEHVRPSFKRLNRFVKIFKPAAALLYRLRLANKGQLGNLMASDAQMKLLDRGVWRYKVVIATKP